MSYRIRAARHLAGLVAAAPAYACASSYRLPPGVTPIAREVYGLHVLLFGICAAIAVAVCGAILWSVWRFRSSHGAGARTTPMHARMAEIAWTAVPVVILVGMAIPAARALIRMDEARDAGLAVKVTGYERRWRYEYLGSGVGFYSSLAQDPSRAGLLLAGADPATDQDLPPRVDHPLVVPVGTRVRLLLSGADLKHSWWVPDLAVRSDASPGLTGVAWFTADRLGRYQGQCAQRCGHDHGRTPIVVEVVSQADFAQWLAAQQAAALAAGASAATTAMATDPRVP